jgi:uncharacterized protein YndB with AHSA1/START domain
VRPVHRAARTARRSGVPASQSVTLTFRRVLHHPPETVWKAITDPDQVRQWFLTESHVDGSVGGKVELITGPERVRATGVVLSWDPPRLYEFEWNTADTDHPFPGERSVIRWELTHHQNGTLVVLTHRNLSLQTARVFGHGLPGFLDRLEALLDGAPLPERRVWVPQSPSHPPAAKP